MDAAEQIYKDANDSYRQMDYVAASSGWTKAKAERQRVRDRIASMPEAERLNVELAKLDTPAEILTWLSNKPASAVARTLGWQKLTKDPTWPPLEGLGQALDLALEVSSQQNPEPVPAKTIGGWLRRLARLQNIEQIVNGVDAHRRKAELVPLLPTWMKLNIEISRLRKEPVEESHAAKEAKALAELITDLKIAQEDPLASMATRLRDLLLTPQGRVEKDVTARWTKQPPQSSTHDDEVVTYSMTKSDGLPCKISFRRVGAGDDAFFLSTTEVSVELFTENVNWITLKDKSFERLLPKQEKVAFQLWEWGESSGRLEPNKSWAPLLEMGALQGNSHRDVPSQCNLARRGLPLRLSTGLPPAHLGRVEARVRPIPQCPRPGRQGRLETAQPGLG